MTRPSPGFNAGLRSIERGAQSSPLNAWILWRLSWPRSIERGGLPPTPGVTEIKDVVERAAPN